MTIPKPDELVFIAKVSRIVALVLVLALVFAVSYAASPGLAVFVFLFTVAIGVCCTSYGVAAAHRYHTTKGKP